MRPMIIPRCFEGKAGAASLAGLALLAALASSARADRIRLRGGGEVRGAVRTDPKNPDVLLVQTINGSSPIAFPREDIVGVIEEEDILDEYDARLAEVPETAEAHYQFGLWCEEGGLSGLAEVHYRRAVELDEEHGPAHKKLGHVQHRGTWITYDELRAAEGLVLYEGRWIPPQERERIEGRQADRAAHEAAARQVRVLRRGVASPSLADRADAERRLFELAGPGVVSALVEVLGADPDPYVRGLLIRLLGSVEGPESSRALVGRALDEEDASTRRDAVAELARRDDPDARKALVSVLGARSTRAAGRAALALAGLGATEAIPDLIDALVRVERRLAWVPTTRPAAGPVSRAPVSGLNVTGQSIPVLTDPVVGDGAVAYGATSVPYGSGVGINLGSGGTTPGPPEPRVVTRVHRNPDVLAALESLTGRNFGFDEDSWRRWLAEARRANPQVPARRVPQP